MDSDTPNDEDSRYPLDGPFTDSRAPTVWARPDPWNELGVYGILVQHIREPDTICKLVAGGELITDDSVIAASEWSIDSLGILLDAGGNVNARSRWAHDPNEGVSCQWTNVPDFVRFEEDWKEMYLLHRAAKSYGWGPEINSEVSLVIEMILDFNPELFALFRQPLVPIERNVLVFPGNNQAWAIQAWPTVKPRYGQRSMLHAMLEDGLHIGSLLRHHAVREYLEHRDPQGRTILHSLCRSAIGADSAGDVNIQDFGEHRQSDIQIPDPYATTSSRPSIFDMLLGLRPDMLAIDAQGKTALHHLLESEDRSSSNFRPPKIRNSLLRLIHRCPNLINQRDYWGDYPLHTALQRLRRYPRNSRWAEAQDLKLLIDDLLAAGADPHVTDRFGNNALHYIADDGLVESEHDDIVRQRFRAFVERGVNINARNKAGQTPLDIFLAENGRFKASWNRLQWVHVDTKGFLPGSSLTEIYAQLFEMFDKAGVDWGQTGWMGMRTARYKSLLSARDAEKPPPHVDLRYLRITALVLAPIAFLGLSRIAESLLAKFWPP